MNPSNLRKTQVRAVLLLMATAGLGVLAGCSKSDKEQAPVVTVQAAPAQKGEISRLVAAEAIIFPIAQSVITPKISAPVKRLLLTRGQNVHNGQLLAEL